VDVGVHQDGLVHVSAMSRNFVSDPRQVTKPGEVVRVRVLSIDIARKRISLTMRLDDEPGGTGRAARGDEQKAPTGARPEGRGGQDRGGPGRGGQDRGGQDRGGRGRGGQDRGGQGPGGQAGGGAMADALRRAGLTGGPADAPGGGKRSRPS
jgi:uncharacterized protein